MSMIYTIHTPTKPKVSTDDPGIPSSYLIAFSNPEVLPLKVDHRPVQQLCRILPLTDVANLDDR